MLNVIKNIREHTKNLQMTVLDYWGIKSKWSFSKYL